MSRTSAVIDLIGIERALSIENKSVFDNMVLPDGIDKDILVNTILQENGSFELMYSDPEFLTGSIYIWSRKYYHTFDKWIKALMTDYSPLENYDRIEESTLDHSGSASNTSKSDSSGSNSSESSSETDITVTDKTSAYNASTFENKAQSTTDDDVSTNASGEYQDHSTGEGSSKDQFKDITKSRIHGNIGVTTSQQMLISEMDLRGKYNIYKMISDLFKKEFCIMVF